MRVYDILPSIMIRLAFFIAAAMTAIHFSAIEWGLYSGKVWIDIPLHFLGGALLGVIWLYLSKKIFSSPPSCPLAIFQTGSFALLGSFAWEALEFAVSELFPAFALRYKFYSFTVSDVISDMAFGLLGGVIAAMFYWALAARRETPH